MKAQVCAREFDSYKLKSSVDRRKRSEHVQLLKCFRQSQIPELHIKSRATIRNLAVVSLSKHASPDLTCFICNDSIDLCT